MVQDALGNEVNVHDMVMIQFGDTWALAEVASVNEGGILVGGGNKVSPGRVICVISLNVDFNPKRPIVPGIIKVHKPAKQNDLAMPEPSGEDHARAIGGVVVDGEKEN